MRILVINGPNLNLLGKREPEIYGTKSMESIMIDIQQTWHDICFTYKQSNHEGNLIDWIQATGDRQQETGYAGIVLNAGGYTHTSVSIRDAVAACNIPVVEVHISNIFDREPFRKISLLTDVCQHSIIGHGTDGYKEAVQWLIEHQ
ncbi:MAG: 3-dehydroquinate dehydratase [Paludibacteraceae bacterium]|nr:3-dehydroquinate dehydratase [Paludibacteraceae bacterium]